MILINRGTIENPLIVQCSVCIGIKKNSSTVTNVVSNIKYNINGEKTLYENGLLENAAVNFYNGFKYDDTYITEDSNNIDGANGRLRYTGTAAVIEFNKSSSTTSNNTKLTYYRNRIINKYDSFMQTIHATNSTQYFNPTTNPRDTSDVYYAGMDFKSDGCYSRNKFAEQAYVDPHQAELPSPVLINTTGGNKLQIYLNDVLVKELNVNSKVSFVYNLEPNKTYSYKLLNNNTEKATGTFSTSGLIRMIKMDQVKNVRDIGGYLTTDKNYRFKYGKIFRGSLFDTTDNYGGLSTTGLSNNDKKTFIDELKITKELDLRKLINGLQHIKNNSDVSIAEYLNSNSGATSYNGLATNFAQFITFITAILTGNTYVHCKEGRDRTGTFCETFLALCDINTDGICKDYELTSFWGNSTWRTELLYWEHTDPNNNTKSTWTANNTFKAMKPNATSSDTIQGIVLYWFTNNYTNQLDSLYGAAGKDWTNGNSSTNALKAQDIIAWLKEIFLEPVEKKTLNQN